MRNLYLFALSLVIYEFSTYVSNDMIMPGMLQVVHEFNAPISYVSLSVSLYIFGNCLLQLFLGPLAEHFGKRKVILSGNLLFIVFTFFVLFSQNINQFMFGRFIQGSGLAFIAIGYALIHESFDDKHAVKLFALMANVSLLAPLLGPLLGSMIIAKFGWRATFVLTAIISTIAIVGLFKYTPNKPVISNIITQDGIWINYKKILFSKQVMFGAFATSINALPVLIWIGVIPTIIMNTMKYDMFHYAIFQLFSIGGLMVSSIAMQKIAGKFSFYHLISRMNILAFIGLVWAFIFHDYIGLVLFGMFLQSFGLGISNNLIMRLVMTTPNLSQSMVTSVLIFIQTLCFGVGIEIANLICKYCGYTLLTFTMINLVVGVVTLFMVKNYALMNKSRSWE